MVCAANVEYFEKYHLLRGSEYTSIDFSFLILDRFLWLFFEGSHLCVLDILGVLLVFLLDHSSRD